MSDKQFWEAARPRLGDPGSFGVGPGPLSPAWPKPVAPKPSADPVEALAAELTKLRTECYAVQRTARSFVDLLVGYREIERLNVQFAEIRRMNAELHHPRFSKTVADWPEPVLPVGVVLSMRDLIAPLGLASAVCAAALAERETWFYQNAARERADG